MASADADESDEGEGFPPADRKVVTQSYDLSVQTLKEKWDTEELVLPEIQREYVWDNPRASRLIESLLLNIPIPVLYFAETDDVKWEIFDGQQRVRSVVRFLNNEFRLSGLNVLSEFKGLRYHQLPAREQRFLTARMMRAVVISIESHPNMKFEIFERLNTGAVILNAQELRNSLYRGPFNALLRELVKEPSYRVCIGTSNPRKRMVDEELALRFFALSSDLANYRPPQKVFLNEYMRSVQYADDAQLDELRTSFSRAVTRVEVVWGPAAFKLTDGRGRATERSPNRALFDAQMLAFQALPASIKVVDFKKQIIRAFAKLYRNEDFIDSISLATGDRSRTLYRVGEALQALRTAGIKVKSPKGL
jgi:Protein of unknown function DUF262